MQHYLVTGGVGFIGSHLVKSLLGDSIRITVVDRRPWDESPILRSISESAGFDFIKVDLRDADKTAKLIAKTKPDVIYHLAAQPLSILSNIDPFNTAQDNIIATYSILEAVRNHSPDSRLVYTSSACFYGVPISSPLREMDTPAVGHYIYTATKIAADFAVQHYQHIYNLDCISVRMVNVYGPGEMHFERIVPRLVLQALRGEAPTLTQSDGTDVLSFLYVNDTVAALRLLGTHPDATDSAVWNIAGSPPLSISELMKKIYKLVGQQSQDSFAAIGSRCGAPVHKYLDGTMIREKLGFSPSTDLESGLKITIDWYKQYLGTASAA